MWVWVGAISAALFNLLGFLTIGYLGAVPAMVVGNMKTPTTILVSCIVFGNIVTGKQILGFLVGVTGVIVYDKYGKTPPAKVSYDQMREITGPGSPGVVSAETVGKTAAYGDRAYGLEDTT